MYVLGTNGSPMKDGHTKKLLNEILNVFATAGADTKLYDLNFLEFSGCWGCNYCKDHEEGCPLQDDMKNIYPEINQADVLVIASPVYMWQMSSQSKKFVDRLYAYYKSPLSLYPAKTNVVLAFSQGHPNLEEYKNYFKYTADFFKFLGYNVTDIIVSDESGHRMNIPVD